MLAAQQITFCPDADRTRNFLGFVVGLPLGALVGYGTFRVLYAHAASNAIVRYIKRALVVLVFVACVGSTAVIIGGPCTLAGQRYSRTHLGDYDNRPRSLSERLKFVATFGIIAALIFPFVISKRRDTA